MCACGEAEEVPQLSKYRDVKNYSCMFEISRLSAARQLGQPMHSKSANFEKLEDDSQILAGIILHDSVHTNWGHQSFKCRELV